MATSPHVSLSEEANVNVVVRIRPPVEREKQLGYKKCMSVDPLGHSITVSQPPIVSSISISPNPLSPPPPIPRTFTFDYVADEFVNQEEIFMLVGKPMAHACLQGYHCCLIAYGQTGAGKTYTMEGPTICSNMNELDDSTASIITEEFGLIPRILETIFLILAAEKEQSGEDVEFSVKCSSLQIYNEQVEDLLCPHSTNLTIHEDSKNGMYVEGLREVEVQTPEATYEVLKQGSLNRHVGATAMNLESSRSHGVFILSLESQRQNLGVLNRRISRFYLVDLAGSERQKQTEAVGLRLRESGSINRSLSALGNVIKALMETSEGKIRHIPYRDSKLTYLLKNIFGDFLERLHQKFFHTISDFLHANPLAGNNTDMVFAGFNGELGDALGGNSKCTLIANISPSIINVDETLSTLKFAQRAKFMKNLAIVNEDTIGNGSASAEEIRKLRVELAAIKAKIATGDQSISWNDHTSNNQVRRLEYIISQSTKQALAGERKTAQEMHSLMRKMDALKSMYMRLDRTLQALNATNLQKQRKEENFSTSSTFSHKKAGREITHLHSDKTNSSDDASVEAIRSGKIQGKDESKAQSDNSRVLHSKIVDLQNANQSMKLEIENLMKEKKAMSAEFSHERDQSKTRLISLENEIEKLKEIIQKMKEKPSDDMQFLDEEKALLNFQKKKNIRTFTRFVSRPVSRKTKTFCNFFKRKR